MATCLVVYSHVSLDFFSLCELFLEFIVHYVACINCYCAITSLVILEIYYYIPTKITLGLWLCKAGHSRWGTTDESQVTRCMCILSCLHMLFCGTVSYIWFPVYLQPLSDQPDLLYRGPIPILEF